MKTFIDELIFKPPRKYYTTNELIYNHIDEIWSIDLAVFSGYKFSINEGYRYIIIISDNFSKYLWCILPKIKNSQLIKQVFSDFLSTSKRKPIKIESDGGAEFYNSFSQNFSKVKNMHHCSRFTDKGRSFAERLIETIRNLLKKPVFEKGSANWISELPYISKQHNNTYHTP